jgi:serine/threonine protein kinase
MSTDAHWPRVTALFDELLDATDGERERVLARHVGDGAAVVAEVRTLLTAHHAADGRFDRPVLTRLTSSQVEALAPPDRLLRAGRVGAFTIVRKIGEGGMGAVYEATRHDATYRQRVAIKTIARGGGTAIIASRFRRERQILAGLQHPNIAMLLDGGVTDDGTPYLVMEYVDGLPIDQWCRQNRLSITERLDLMQQVCRGVQHAHQRLVVHRDLKPQNVFVSQDGVVKLLDFGIAKLIEPNADTPDVTVTRDGATPLTAAYASPEQLRGDPVSTTGDVYSMGVILYELLADVHPFRSAGRTVAQVANEVLTTTPPSPSVACTAEAAQHCGEGDRVRLSRRLSGELDAIVMMAMRKEPERRYSSVEALGTDLQRYLRGLPVAARADTLRYRMQRFVRRNRWPVVLAAALVVVALASGIAILRQSQLARREALRSARVSDFLQAVLGSADVRLTRGVLPRIGPNATVGVLLDNALQHVPTEFADDPAVRARLYLTIGSSRIAQSRMAAAADVLDSAMLLGRAAYGEQSDVYVSANLEAGSAALHRNRFGDALAFAHTAERSLAAARRDTGELYARALTDMAAVALATGDYQELTKRAQQALAFETRRTRDPTIARAVALNRLGIAAVVHDQWRRADTLFDRALATLDSIAPHSNLERFDVQFNRANIAMVFGRLVAADSIVQEALAVSASTFGTNSREFALFTSAHADVERNRGNVAAARMASSEAVRLMAGIPDVISAVRATVLLSRSNSAMLERDWALSDSILQGALRVMRPVDRGVSAMLIHFNLGVTLTHERRLAAADAQLNSALDAMTQSGMHVQFYSDLIHSARAYMYDRGANGVEVDRELALVSSANRVASRSFVMNERALDAKDAATARVHE